jgi:hypothetical protein
LPWNESHLDIRSDHRDPSTFDRDTIRTVPVSEADGIEAVVGKPPGRDYELTLSFLFAKSKDWTMQKAKDWFKEHQHTAEVPLGYWPVGGAAALNQLTVGDLVGKTMQRTIDFPSLETFQSNAAKARQSRPGGGIVSQESRVEFAEAKPSGVSGALCPHDSPCRTLHASLNLPCMGILCGFSGASAATVSPNGAARFDPMQPTIGDLVGTKTVEAAASSPPAVRRIDGRLDLTQPTVGDLVTKTLRGHTSGRTVSAAPDDFLVHPSRVKEVSR